MNIDSMRKVMAGDSMMNKRRLLDALVQAAEPEVFDVVYDGLSDPSDFVVSSCLKVIDARAAKFPVSVKKIVDLYRSASERTYIRALCVRVLGNAENPVAVKPVVDAFDDREETVQLEAVEAAVKYRRAAVIPLVNALTEEEAPWSRREKCAIALAMLASDKKLEVETTVKNVLSLRTENVQFAVVRAFKDIGAKSLFDALKSFLKVETLENSVEIKRLLKQVSRKEEMENLISSLAKMDEKRCLELIVALKSGRRSVEQINTIERILKASSDNKRMKAIIVRIMGLARNEKVMPLLTECLKDPDKRVRSNAVEAITDIGGDYAIDLVKPLLSDFDNRVKANAAKGLWKLGGVRSLQILREMMESKDKWMRASAAYALGEIGVMQVVELLLPGLSDPDPDVKINTVRALARSGDLIAVNSVIDVARNRSEEWAVRKNAIIALGKSGRAEALAFLETLAAAPDETPLVKETVNVVLKEVREP